MEFIVIPFMSALLAWAIAWLFVKFIFFSWNQQLAKQIAAMDISNLSKSQGIQEQLDKAIPFIDTQLEQFFKTKLGEKMPMIAMFIGEQTTKQLKGIFIEELKLVFPQLIQQFATGLQSDFAVNIQNKWKPILEPILLRATKPYRLFAIIAGGFWGIIIALLIHHY